MESKGPWVFFVATGDPTPPKNRFGYVICPEKPHGEGRIDSPTTGDPRARKDSKHFTRKLAHVGFFFNMYTYMRQDTCLATCCLFLSRTYGDLRHHFTSYIILVHFYSTDMLSYMFICSLI